MSVSHPIFARVYNRLSRVLEVRGGAEHRRTLLAGLAGRVIEVGAGNGLNFAYYPPTVAQLVAVEPEAHLRDLARREAARAPIPIRVVDGLAGDLPSADAEFDAGVASLVLCSVRVQRRALDELFRVVRPGGELRFYEHVRAREPRLARIQALADLVWPHLTGGCHASRDTETAILQAGFVIEQLRRFRFPQSRLFIPTSPHILGIARRPAA